MSRDSFEDRLVDRLESIGEALAGSAIAGFDELHEGDGGEGGGSDELDHDLRIADVGRLDIEACGLERVEELLDETSAADKDRDTESVAKGCDRMRRQKPPVDRLAILGRRGIEDKTIVRAMSGGQIARSAMQRLAQYDAGEPYREFSHPRIAPWCSRDFHLEPALFGQTVNMTRTADASAPQHPSRSCGFGTRARSDARPSGGSRSARRYRSPGPTHP